MSFFHRLENIWSGVDVSQSYAYLKTGKSEFDAIQQLVLEYIEHKPLSKRILFVSASGWFTGAYSIFSMNVVSPALAYIWWPDLTIDDRNTRNLGINIATLVGLCVGMILFGYLADCFGRKRLYGVELVIVIVATLGLTQVSRGYNNSMDIYPWIIFWRTLLGIGVGAEYPLSALIASEWSSTQTRGRMLAAVFLMQPIAQLVAYGVGLGALRSMKKNIQNPPRIDHHEEVASVLDGVWRLVVGVGAGPALLAIIGRLTIPETPRYLLEIEKDAPGAFQSAADVFSPPSSSEVEAFTNAVTAGTNTSPAPQDIEAGGTSHHIDRHHEDQGHSDPNQPAEALEMREIPGRDIQERAPNQADRADTGGNHTDISAEEAFLRPQVISHQWRKSTAKKLRKFLQDEEYGSILAAASFCWFILDVLYYGLGLDNPQLLLKIWRAHPPESEAEKDAAQIDPDDPNFYEHLDNNFVNAMRTIAPASIMGCLLILLLVNRQPRVRFMAVLFVVLAVVFAITGGSLMSVYEKEDHSVTVVFYAISLFLLDLGPNTITFMLPAELFPTEYRGTCYGIAAASGKVGAIIIQLILYAAHAGNEKKKTLAIPLLVFTPLALLGALTAWIWIPEVQDPASTTSTTSGKNSIKQYSSYSNRSLEEIAKAPRKGQELGFRSKIGPIFGLKED